MLRRLLRLFRARPVAKVPADPRFEADPWLGKVFALLGERYQLEAGGTRVLRRTARARFNPMPVWIDGRTVRGEVEVRGPAGDRDAVAAQARALLDQRVAPPGLSTAGESVEDWAGTVLTRKYAGAFEDPAQAAAAVRYLCENEQQFNLAAE